GLGPTSDDYTREVVTNWLGLPLIYDSPSWDWINKRLTERGARVREHQQQQCYFPEGATILHNAQGTAHGFFVKKSQQMIFCLPGPPREIQGLWDDHIEMLLKSELKDSEKKITLKWDCLGQGESEIAYLVSQATLNCPFEIGYRLHSPYVEIKITGLESQKEALTFWEQKISAAIKNYCVSRGGDLGEAFTNILTKPVVIFDAATEGVLNTRLASFFFKGNFQNSSHSWDYLNRNPTEGELLAHKDATPIFWLCEIKDGEFLLKISYKNQTAEVEFRSPYLLPTMKLRRKMDACERFFIAALANKEIFADTP
ncbi:MAG: competence/damage-inducible protein A, partial [Pseudobdellovibrionaceae bacterium]